MRSISRESTKVRATLTITMIVITPLTLSLPELYTFLALVYYFIFINESAWPLQIYDGVKLL